MENLILEQQKALENYTKESWAKWLNHKSNKERWIEAQERIADETDEADEEKIADAIDMEDLGARADYEWEKEKDERLGL